MYKTTVIAAVLLLTSCVSEERKVSNDLRESIQQLKEAQKELDEAFKSLDSMDVKVQTDTVR